MKLHLVRQTVTTESVVGSMYTDDTFFCFTLERPLFGPVVCISEGVYEVKMLPSKRWSCLMPHLIAVPGRTEIEIHVGNMAKDSEGCILVGLSKGPNFIGGSRKALDKLIPLIGDGCWITVASQLSAEI